MSENKKLENLKQGIDFYYTEEGFVVFTADYLFKRGYCCESGCRHCPYGYGKEKKNQRIKMEKD